MAELADALESGSSVLIDVGVRLPLSALITGLLNDEKFCHPTVFFIYFLIRHSNRVAYRCVFLLLLKGIDNSSKA